MIIRQELIFINLFLAVHKLSVVIVVRVALVSMNFTKIIMQNFLELELLLTIQIKQLQSLIFHNLIDGIMRYLPMMERPLNSILMASLLGRLLQLVRLINSRERQKSTGKLVSPKLEAIILLDQSTTCESTTTHVPKNKSSKICPPEEDPPLG